MKQKKSIQKRLKRVNNLISSPKFSFKTRRNQEKIQNKRRRKPISYRGKISFWKSFLVGKENFLIKKILSFFVVNSIFLTFGKIYKRNNLDMKKLVFAVAAASFSFCGLPEGGNKEF